MREKTQMTADGGFWYENKEIWRDSDSCKRKQ